MVGCVVTLIVTTQGFCAVYGDDYFKQKSEKAKTANDIQINVESIEIIQGQNHTEEDDSETSNDDQSCLESDDKFESTQESKTAVQTPESAEVELVDSQEEAIKAVENAPSTLEYGSKVGDLVCAEVDLDVPLYWSGQQSVINRKHSAICDPYRNLPWNGPALLADHNTQDFDALYDMGIGQEVYIETQWGTLEYQVDYAGHACCQSDYNHLYTDTGIDVTCTSEQLTMYTCYPRYSNATSPDRYVVLADRIL